MKAMKRNCISVGKAAFVSRRPALRTEDVSKGGVLHSDDTNDVANALREHKGEGATG